MCPSLSLPLPFRPFKNPGPTFILTFEWLLTDFWQTLRGPSSAVSMPIFASRYSLETLDEIYKMYELLHRSDLKNKYNVENQIANMRKYLTKFSWNVEFGAVQKCVNLVDLVKSFQTSIYYLLAKFGFDTAENERLKVCQKIANS